ncbi:MAG: FAD-binding oxidoreductase, partial [Nitrospinota bacterium]
MANIETVLQQIEKELGSEKILVQEAELETWAVDGLIPQGVVFPETIKEISLILRIAHEANVAVIPYGQGTKMGLGGIPRRADLVLSTTRYARVIDYDIPNFTLTA